MIEFALYVCVQLGHITLIDHYLIIKFLFLFFWVFDVRFLLLNHRLNHGGKHVSEFNIDVLVLNVPLILQTFGQEHLSSILNASKVESIKHSAYALGDCLLLVFDILINMGTALNLLELCFGCQALKSKQKGLEKAEVLRPLQGHCKRLIEIEGLFQGCLLFISGVADSIASVLLLCIIAEYDVVDEWHDNLLNCFEVIDLAEFIGSHLECLLAGFHLDSQEHRKEVIAVILDIDKREESAKDRGL